MSCLDAYPVEESFQQLWLKIVHPARWWGFTICGCAVLYESVSESIAGRNYAS
jgi:hypothetical protein